MLYIGYLQIEDTDYLLYWTENKVRNRWLLFSLRTLDDIDRINNGEQPFYSLLSEDMLQISGPENFNNYLVCGLVATKNGDPEYFTGYLGSLNTFVESYNYVTKKIWKKDSVVETVINNEKRIERKDEVSYYATEETARGLEYIKFGYRTVDFVTVKFDPSVSNTSIKAFKGLDWVSNDLFKTSKTKNLLKLMGAKTLEQLRSEKDLSWYYNKDGSVKKNYKVLHTIEDVKWVCSVLAKPDTKVFAIDTETDGLNVYNLDKDNETKNSIVGMSISWNINQGVYIPFKHTEFENCPLEESIELLRPFLENGNIICHNGMFDGKVFWDLGVRLNITEDSMIMNFNRNPTESKGNNSLKGLTRNLLNHETLELDDIFKKKDDAVLFKFLPEDIVRIYACADTDYTIQVWLSLRKQLPKVSKTPYQLDCAVQRELSISEYNGNAIDMELLKELSYYNEQDIKILENEMEVFVGKVGYLTSLKEVLDELVFKKELTQREADEKFVEAQKTEEFKNRRRQFRLSSNDELKETLYQILKYPVLRVTKGSNKPAVDKFALEDLGKVVTKEPGNYLVDDIFSSMVGTPYEDDSNRVLIKAEKFNKSKYPFVVLLQKWKKLEKLRTAFFNPLLEGNLEGKYFAPFKMCNAETGRIINRVQTLIGQLKKLIVPFDKNEYYMCVFDFAQIEYRAVAGLSGTENLVETLQNPRADYHREGGAKFYNVEPWQITKDQRSKLKVVNFAKLYKMGDHSLSEALFGRTYDKAEQEKNLKEATTISLTWEKVNYKMKAYLDAFSQFAVEKGYVENCYGRRRYFDMKDLTPSKTAKIERMAGNYPIQSFAAEIFKIAFLKLRQRLRKEGLDQKVFTTMLIHDELVNVVHKSVNPYFLYKIIVEECMLEIEGHPRYYAGISICDNWYEGKEDLFEAPIEFVLDKVKENPVYQDTDWYSNAKETVLSDIEDYMQKIYFKELKELQKDLSPELFDLKSLMPKFTDYFLNPRMFMYVGSYRKPDKSIKSDEVMASIEKVFMDEWHVDSLNVTYPNGETKAVCKGDFVPGNSYRKNNPRRSVLASGDLDLDSLEFDLDLEFNEKLSESNAFDLELEDELDLMFDDSDQDNEPRIIDISVASNIVHEEQEEDILAKELAMETKLYSTDTRFCGVYDDKFVITVDRLNTDEFTKLWGYCVSNSSTDGLPLVIIKDQKEFPTEVRLKGIDFNELSNYVGKSFFEFQM